MDTGTIRKVMDLLGENYDSEIGEALGIPKGVIQSEREHLLVQRIGGATTIDECQQIARNARHDSQGRREAYDKSQKMLAEQLSIETTAMGCIAICNKYPSQELGWEALRKALSCTDVDLEACQCVFRSDEVSEELREQAVMTADGIYAKRLKACSSTWECLRLVDRDNRRLSPSETMQERIFVQAVSFIEDFAEYEAVLRSLGNEQKLRQELKTSLQEAIVRIENGIAPRLEAAATFEECLKLLEESPHDFSEKVLAKMMWLAKTIPQWQQCLKSARFGEEGTKLTCIHAIAALIEKEEVSA